MQIPRATYRLQFNEHFRLADALALVPYFHDLGISHIYASPLFKAAPHSVHGYDVCDFSQLNPEIGTEADLEKLVERASRKKMGLVSGHRSQSHGNRLAGKSVVAGCSEKWPREQIRKLFRHRLGMRPMQNCAAKFSFRFWAAITKEFWSAAN